MAPPVEHRALHRVGRSTRVLHERKRDCSHGLRACDKKHYACQQQHHTAGVWHPRSRLGRVRRRLDIPLLSACQEIAELSFQVPRRLGRCCRGVADRAHGGVRRVDRSPQDERVRARRESGQGFTCLDPGRRRLRVVDDLQRPFVPPTGVRVLPQSVMNERQKHGGRGADATTRCLTYPRFTRASSLLLGGAPESVRTHRSEVAAYRTR